MAAAGLSRTRGGSSWRRCLYRRRATDWDRGERDPLPARCVWAAAETPGAARVSKRQLVRQNRYGFAFRRRSPEPAACPPPNDVIYSARRHNVRHTRSPPASPHAAFINEARARGAIMGREHVTIDMSSNRNHHRVGPAGTSGRCRTMMDARRPARQSISVYAIILGHVAAIYAPSWRPGRLSSPPWPSYRRHPGPVAGRSGGEGVARAAGRDAHRQGSYSSAGGSGSPTDRAMFVRIHYSRSVREKFACLAVAVRHVFHTTTHALVFTAAALCAGRGRGGR